MKRIVSVKQHTFLRGAVIIITAVLALSKGAMTEEVFVVVAERFTL